MAFDFENIEIFELGRVSLSQNRFKDGMLFVTGIKHDNKYTALDIRFYLKSDDGNWRPTKTGFWVAKEYWQALRDVLAKEPKSIGELVCWKNKSRRFVVRYIPTYGGGVDFRYYSETKKYTGWEKKGIRIAIRDYDQVQRVIVSSIERLTEMSSSEEKFENGMVCRKDQNHHMQQFQNVLDPKPINSALKEILGD